MPKSKWFRCEKKLYKLVNFIFWCAILFLHVIGGYDIIIVYLSSKVKQYVITNSTQSNFRNWTPKETKIV